MSKTDWTTEERKLQSVYDDVSEQRYKPAESTVTRHLKKHPKSQPALVLRMVLLEKTGKSFHEVLRAYKDVKGTGELSARSMWWTCLTLRGIGRQDLILKLYQSLWDAHPQSYDVGEQVLLYAAAVGDRELVVTTSRKMFNQQKNAVWARVAAWGEWFGKSSQPTPSQPFPPPLDPTTLRTSLTLLSTTRQTIPSADVLWLHLQLYLSAGQVDTALDLARKETDGALGRAYYRIELVREVHRRLTRRPADGLIKEEEGLIQRIGAYGPEKDEEKVKGVWKVEYEWVAGVLRESEESQRNYLFYRHLVLSALHASDPTLIESAKSLLSELDSSIGSKERAPKLALLELDLRLRNSGASSGAMGMSDEQYVEKIKAYWDQWGAKGCVVDDFRTVVREDQARADLICGFLGFLEGWMGDKEHTNLDGFLRLQNAEIFCAAHSTKGKGEKEITDDDFRRIWSLYLSGLRYGADLPKTDVQPANDSAFLAIHHLLSLYHRTQDEIYAVRAIVALRYIARRSPSELRAQFLLVRLCRLVGAPSLAALSINKIQPTEIQLDNVLHVLTERGGVDALLGQTTAVWTMYTDKAALQYKRSASDLPEYIKQALQHESYTKLHGIRHLFDAMKSSLSRGAAEIESARIHLISQNELTPSDEDSLRRIEGLERMSDNRNWELMPDLLGAGEKEGMRGVTSPGVNGEMSEGWVRAWAGVLGGVGRWARGEDVGQLIVPDQARLLPAERGMLESAAALLSRADGAIKAAETTDGDAAGSSVSGIFEAGLQFCLSEDKVSRWQRLYTIALVVELSRIVELVQKRLQDLVKPKKGKKPPAAVSELVGELKSAREGYKDVCKRLVGLLEDTQREDEERLKVEVLSEGLGVAEDEEFVKQVCSEMSEGRKSALDTLRRLVEGKK